MMNMTKWSLVPAMLLFVSTLAAQTEPPVRPLVPVDPSRLPLPGEAVSARDLLIPPKALKEFQRSVDAVKKGDVRSSAKHLEKALAIYPRSPEAHNNLGSRYIALQQYERAAAEFQKAIDLEPQLKQPFNNLSVALFLLHRYPEAEAAARSSLTLDPLEPTSRYMLGCTLAMDHRNPAEAITLLRQTTAEYPDSRLVLALLLVRQGASDEAQNELREYLKAPDPGKRQRVECWLARLSHSVSASCPAPLATP